VSDNSSTVSITAALVAVPAGLQETVHRHWADFILALARDGHAPPNDADLLATLCRVWAVSEFAARQCLRQSAQFMALLDSGDLQRRYDPDTQRRHLLRALIGVADAQTLALCLRRQRQREMLRIAWRDISCSADLDETMADLTALADACVQIALNWLHMALVAELGEPCDARGEPQRMVVLGMGKLGAGELNFSSDIDLIFAYPETGKTSQGRSNEEFFIRLGRQLIRILDENTADGFVFRVDMRLRPFGRSGALVSSFAAMEHYYQAHGRDWERYALIKARVVVDGSGAGAQLLERLRPFIYRRYLDYGSFEALREMKQKIEAEVRHQSMDNHVKLGPGGIREVEFIGQVFQLVRGGREPALQRREIQRVLAWLGEHDYLPDYGVEQLLAAYRFLRNTEHRLQEYQDRQTHRLPDDELGRLRLAFAMGFDDWDAFLPVLRGHMARVHGYFEQVFAAPQAEWIADPRQVDLAGVWSGGLDKDEAVAVLTAAGFEDPSDVWASLRVLQQGYRYQAQSRTGRARLDRLMPLLLEVVTSLDLHDLAPDAALQRLLQLVDAIARRSAYLALLVEHPLALSQLVQLCAASPWISRLLTRHPLLLDELLDPRSLYTPLDRTQLTTELRTRLVQVPADDLEQVMDVLRQFKQAAVLRVAAVDVVAAVPLMQVSDYLTDIAEVILAEVLAWAWTDKVARHGQPAGARALGSHVMGFAIIAYGKLGGIELGYGSDLDLVFVHGSDDLNAMTDGPKPVADAVFFARLGQRIIHMLTAHTAAGVLYEVDMRLRPSGASGLLVSSLTAYADYQCHKAWTWEHQALVRARPVAGDACIGDGFDAVRREVLGRGRDPENLRRDIVEMRERMRMAAKCPLAGWFDLKQGRGGIADIEFMVQYGVLRWACECPALMQYTDNIRLLQVLAVHSRLVPEDATVLGNAYRAYRAEVHRLTLQEWAAVVEERAFADQRTTVRRLWRALLETPLETKT
jgi:glutamate-ammonia-ligase adenylyltransferase